MFGGTREHPALHEEEDSDHKEPAATPLSLRPLVERRPRRCSSRQIAALLSLVVGPLVLSVRTTRVGPPTHLGSPNLLTEVTPPPIGQPRSGRATALAPPRTTTRGSSFTVRGRVARSPFGRQPEWRTFLLRSRPLEMRRPNSPSVGRYPVLTSGWPNRSEPWCEEALPTSKPDRVRNLRPEHWHRSSIQDFTLAPTANRILRRSVPTWNDRSRTG